MSLKTNMSAGELFDLIMPAAFIVSGLVSTWVLASARKRFQLFYSMGLALGTLFLPLIVFPLYLVIIIWRKKIGPPERWRYLLPLLYAVVVLSTVTLFFYFDGRTVDAHLARAARAKLVEDTSSAIREYKAALVLEDDPHTHKLLAIELANEGSFWQAISEFRLAQQGGEPDDLISYRLGLVFERLNQDGQARLEFQNFLLSNTCLQLEPRCEIARQRVDKQR